MLTTKFNLQRIWTRFLSLMMTSWLRTIWQFCREWRSLLTDAEVPRSKGPFLMSALRLHLPIRNQNLSCRKSYRIWKAFQHWREWLEKESVGVQKIIITGSTYIVGCCCSSSDQHGRSVSMVRIASDSENKNSHVMCCVEYFYHLKNFWTSLHKMQCILYSLEDFIWPSQ